VEVVFDEVDRSIASLEDDPSLVPSSGECGGHFNVSFDPAFGYPSYHDSLGPCDDGVGLTVRVTTN
jgi:hypothetical protein